MTRPLRILLVHERFPPDYAGGGEYVVLETARYLQAAGHAVTVLTAGDPAQTSFEGIATTRLPFSRLRFAFAWQQVAHAARGADIIQCFSYYSIYPAARAARQLGKPVVLCVLALFDRIWLDMRGALVGRVMRALERFLMRVPMTARIYLSDESLALAHANGLQQVGDQVLAPGITLSDYHAAEDKPFILFAGKLDVRKGIDTVLAAARSMPQVPFRLVGWGPRFAEIAAMCPPNVTLERFQDRLHLAMRLSQARIFLFPTMAETFGLVVAEAMASGCAIVSTSTLPFAGERIAGGDAKAACQAVRALWDDPARCAAAGKLNVERSRAYCWEQHVQQLAAVYRQAIDERP